MEIIHFFNDGYEISCRSCLEVFWICRRCYRNHRYCSKNCRQEGRRASQRISRRKHQQSDEGRLDHRDRQKSYRDRHRKKFTQPRATVTEHCIEDAQSLVQTPIEFKSAELEFCVCCSRSRFAMGSFNYAKRDTIRP